MGKKSFFILLFLMQNLFAGFSAGTLVKTEHARIPIERLAAGSRVFCQTPQNKLAVRAVIQKHLRRAHRCICIVFDGDTLIATPDQRLFLATRRFFASAQQLKVGDLLLSRSGEQVIVRDVHSITRARVFFDLTVADYHTYFVSRREILAHNVVPVAICFAWAFGGGTLEFIGASISAMIFGVAVGAAVHSIKTKGACSFCCEHANCLLQNNKNVFEKLIKKDVQKGGGSGGPGDPKKPKDSKNLQKPGEKPPEPQNRQMRFPCQEKKKDELPPQLPNNASAQKERKFNTVHKSEFFNKPEIENNYRSTRDGSHVLKPKGTPLEGADRLAWDKRHHDVEAYKNEKHLGSIDPQTMKLYKPRVPNRFFRR